MPKKATDLTRLKGGSKQPTEKRAVAEPVSPRRRIITNPLKPGVPIKPK
jgi:hypothetical protein